MKKFLAIVLNMALLLSVMTGFSVGVSAAPMPQVTEKATMDVWLIAGQSNAFGMGTVAEYPSDPTYAEYKTLLTNTSSNVWYYGNNDAAFASCGFMGKQMVGPEIGIVTALNGDSSNNAVIKVGWGNTSLYNNTTSAQSKEYGTWTPPSYIKKHNISTEGNKVGDLYETFIEKVDSGLALIEEKGYVPVIKGIWYMQGEAETFNETSSTPYAELLETLIYDMRNDLSRVSGMNLSGLPFVYGRIYRNPGIDPEKNVPYVNETPYVSAVQAAQDAVAAKNIKNVFMVNTTTDLVDPVTKEAKAPVQQDGWHYDALTQQMIGEKFASVVNDMDFNEKTETITGEGTLESPYIIDSAEKFTSVFAKGSTADLSKVYLLTGFGRTAMELPSTYIPHTAAFTGQLIGGNITDGEITPVRQKINFKISTASANYIAAGGVNNQGVLFHHLDKATVKNLELTGSATAGNNWQYFGVLAGYTTGALIENIHSYADVDTKVGRATGVIAGYTNKAADNTKTIIKDCYNYGDISITDNGNNNIGCIVGNMTNTEITNCHNYGNVTGGTTSANGTANLGGIAGYGFGTISGCSNHGNLTSYTKQTGGIAGTTSSCTVTTSYNKGIIANADYAGAIFGNVASKKNGSATNCFNVGDIAGDVATGLVIGENLGTFTVSGFYDVANPDVASVAGVAGTLNVTSAYGLSSTASVIENDVTKVSASELIALTKTDDIFKNDKVWVIDKDYEYPNLVNNKYIAPSISGEGTDANPYIIDTADKYIDVFSSGSTYDTSKVYLLTGFDETAMELPATFKPLSVAFTGKLIGGNIDADGNITNVIQKINVATTASGSIAATSSNSVQGVLFHHINGGTLKNIALTGNVATDYTWMFFGNIAGYLNGNAVIDNVHNYADLTSKTRRATGGLFGWTGGQAKITNCSNHGDIKIIDSAASITDIGGIVGNMTNTTTSDCYNYGNIDAEDCAGGIAGYASSNVNNCANFGNIKASRKNSYGAAGGIAGRTAAFKVTNCYNMGNITSDNYAGGTVGYVASGKAPTVNNFFNAGEIKGNVGSGLVVGNNLGTLTLSGFYDIANADITSVAGVKGTLAVTSAYSYGETALEQTNDVNKVSLDAIVKLTETDEIFKNTEVWTSESKFGYPDLVLNMYNSEFVGEGTEASPYRVYSLADLKNVDKNPSASFIQMNDIKGMDVMLCKETEFSGIYDGDGHFIELAIDDTENETYPKFVGLFAKSSGKIINLNTTGVVNAGYVDWQGGAGVFIGKASGDSGSLENCNNYAAINSDGHQTAGLIGSTANKFKIYKCFNYGDVYGHVKASGLVGLLQSGVSLYYCGNYGNITGDEAAGITTWSYTYAQVYNTFNVGTITSNTVDGIATGLIGNISNGNTVTNIKDCFNAGTLLGDTTYGICYSNANKTKDYNIINCYNTAAADYPIAGGSATPTITNSYYLADSTDESANALTLEELKSASETLGSTVWSVTGDYLYPQITKNAINANYDNIDFALVTISDTTENSEVYVHVNDNEKFYVKKGTAVKLNVTPGADFYAVDILCGEEVVYSDIDVATQVFVMVTDDCEISATDKAIAVELPENIDSVSSVITSETSGGVVINDKLYTKYAIVASKIPEIKGLKLKSFGIYAGNSPEELINNSNKFAGESGKITSDGSFGVLLFGNEQLLSEKAFAVPYAVYENVNGEIVELTGNVAEF